MIIGVAVRLEGEVYSLLAPARHGQVLRLIAACYPDDPNAALKCEQGFVSDDKRFLTREEAREDVKRQMNLFGVGLRATYPRLKNHGAMPGRKSYEPSRHPTEIFSEDLW
jgi:hypothetical protein